MIGGTKPLEYERLCFISDGHYIIVDSFKGTDVVIAKIDTDDMNLMKKL
jgi:hypothetical protein